MTRYEAYRCAVAEDCIRTAPAARNPARVRFDTQLAVVLDVVAPACLVARRPYAALAALPCV